jgi:hypothetical protein
MCVQDFDLALMSGGEDYATFYHRGNALLAVNRTDHALGQ